MYLLWYLIAVEWYIFIFRLASKILIGIWFFVVLENHYAFDDRCQQFVYYKIDLLYSWNIEYYQYVYSVTRIIDIVIYIYCYTSQDMYDMIVLSANDTYITTSIKYCLYIGKKNFRCKFLYFYICVFSLC